MSDDTLDDPMDALDVDDQETAASTEGDAEDGDDATDAGAAGDADDGVRQEVADEIERLDEAEDADASGGGGDGDGDAGDDDRVEELEAALEERDERIEQLEGRLKRVQADFENYKKRAERKREEFAKYAAVDLISELLAVRDDLDRALDSDGDIREGVELVAEDLDAILEDEGVERIAAEGTPDPERHEVMMQVDDADAAEGEIVDVYEPGYRMEDRVIRPAKVTVASGDGDGDG